jgi:hypothetical protein
VRRHPLFHPRHPQGGLHQDLSGDRASRLHLDVARRRRRQPDFDLPAFEEWDMEDQGWVRWRIDPLGTLPIHPQEILDNMATPPTSCPVHGSRDIVYFENEFAITSDDPALWRGAPHAGFGRETC